MEMMKQPVSREILLVLLEGEGILAVINFD